MYVATNERFSLGSIHGLSYHRLSSQIYREMTQNLVISSSSRVELEKGFRELHNLGSRFPARAREEDSGQRAYASSP